MDKSYDIKVYVNIFRWCVYELLHVSVSSPSLGVIIAQRKEKNWQLVRC